MNIDVLGRIRPTLHGEGAYSLEVDSHHKLSTGPGGTYFSFLTLYKRDSTNFEIYKKSVDPLVDLFIAGYNTSFMVIGETGSGKSFTLGGESSNKSGLIPIAIDQLFQRVKTDERYLYDNRMNDEPSSIHMQMIEVYNDQVRDLLTVPRSSNDFIDLEETAEKGVHPRHCSNISIKRANDATTLFRQGWGRKTEAYTDFGPANNYAAVITTFELELQTKDDPFPHKSKMTFIEMPGLEKLGENPDEMRLREGPILNRGIGSFGSVVRQLAAVPSPNRVINYSESKLTQLLQEELGGNCKTRVMLCVKPNPDPRNLSTQFKLSSDLSQIKNFPIRNDSFAQQLLTQQRAQIIDLKRQLGVNTTTSRVPDKGTPDSADIRKLQTDNLQLRDKNERLHYRLGQIQDKFGLMAQNKTDLSGQLLMTEEEKLKVSKTLVEMQIENNKLLEEMEAIRFELTNKILQLESDLMEREVERDKYIKTANNAREKLEEIERERKDLADEYVSLKTNYLAQTKDHKFMTAKVEELSMELLNLVNAKALLMRQLQNLGRAKEFAGDPDREIERIKAMVDRSISARYKPEAYRPSQREKDDVENKLFGLNQTRLDAETARMRNEYDDTQKKLEAKILTLGRELTDLRQLCRERQQRISELNAQLITSRSETEDLKHENNRLQNKMKEVNDDYKSRLHKWVEDIADYVDTGAGMPGKHASPERYREFVNNMLKDMKKAHRFREEQLSHAATGFRKKAIETVKKHEQLLVAYRNLQQEIQARGIHDIDLGPDDTYLRILDGELLSSQQKEVHKLQQALTKAETEIEGLRLRLSLKEDPDLTRRKEPKLLDDRRGGSPGTEKMQDLRKQLREFTLNTQQELEAERNNLMTENIVLREQLKESQEYIDKHLVKYKQEIVRLRGLLGMDTEGHMTSMSGAAAYDKLKNNRRR